MLMPEVLYRVQVCMVRPFNVKLPVMGGVLPARVNATLFSVRCSKNTLCALTGPELPVSITVCIPGWVLSILSISILDITCRSLSFELVATLRRQEYMVSEMAMPFSLHRASRSLAASSPDTKLNGCRYISLSMRQKKLLRPG